MPLFYFHRRGPKGLDCDDIGAEFASVEAAYLEACRTVPGMGTDLIYKQEIRPATRSRWSRP